VFDEIFSVNNRFVNETFVFNSVDEQIKQRVVSLRVLEGLAEPILPLAVYLPRVEHSFGTVNAGLTALVLY
jgi:hypothetical protein